MLDERLDAIAQEFAEVEARLSSPEVSANPGLLRELSKRHKELSEVVDAYRRLKVARDDAEAARTLMAETEGSERDELRGELEGAEALILEIDEELQALLLPRDPNLGRNVIVEIRGAEGGEEANLFARDLFDMYLRYAQRRGWKSLKRQIPNTVVSTRSCSRSRAKTLGAASSMKAAHTGFSEFPPLRPRVESTPRPPP